MRRQVSFWVFAMLIAGLLVWALSPAVGFAFVDWDDRHYIVESLFTRHPFAAGLQNFLTTPWYGYPIPLVSLSWAVDARLSEGEAWSFHLTNLLLHLGNTALVFGVARGWGRPASASDPDMAPERLIAHTGGRDVIEAIEQAIPSHKLNATREVLRQYGNISSPSVLTALEHSLKNSPESESLWLTAFGAGFAAHCGELTR
jgi:hypothetical protein